MNLHFDDPYSRGGLAEKDHTFIQSQEIGARLARAGKLLIGELGFGQGLSFLAAMAAARRACGELVFVSFELYPVAWTELVALWRAELGDAATDWNDFLAATALWHHPAAGLNRYPLPCGTLELWVGDARTLLPDVEMMADGWFLDGHSPEKNPELWEESLLRAVGQRTKTGGTLSTYSCATHVLERLRDAGFAVEKVKGWAQKRRMTLGRRLEDRP